MLKKNKLFCTPLSIILISYDSVSRISWLQRLPKTNKFMFEKMQFDLLEGYNIVGDGTPGKVKPDFFKIAKYKENEFLL